MRQNSAFLLSLFIVCSLVTSSYNTYEALADYEITNIIVECVPQLDVLMIRTEDMDEESPESFVKSEYIDVINAYNKDVFPYKKVCKFNGWYKGKTIYVDIRSDIKNDEAVYKILIQHNDVVLLETDWEEKIDFKINGRGYIDLSLKSNYKYSLTIDTPLSIPKKNAWKPYNIFFDKHLQFYMMETGYDIKICCKNKDKCQVITDAIFQLPINAKTITDEYCTINADEYY